MEQLDRELLVSWVGERYLWVTEVFVIVLLTLLIAVMASRFIASLLARAQRNSSIWDDALFEALRSPTRWLIWLIGLSHAAEIAASQAEFTLVHIFAGARQVGGVLVVTWFFVAFIARVEAGYIRGKVGGPAVDATTVMAVGKLLRISAIITSSLVVFQSLGYSISGVLAFGGIGGIAVGFAAKDLLANFFGGLMIYLDRPFAVGEWVRSPDKEIEGTVEEIGWRLTRIRTFDKRPLYVPNATFMQIAVENPSRMTHRRIFETVGIRYEDACRMHLIIEQVEKMISSHPEIDAEQTIIVNFNRFAASSLDFFVYCFTKTTNWVHYHKVKQDVLLKIISVVEHNGAECAFPTSTLHVPHAVKLERNDLPQVES